MTEFKLPKIYPLTDRNLSGLSHLEQLMALAEGGARIVQIRDKHASSREYFDSVQQCLKFSSGNNIKLIVNDRVDIAMVLNADGVHLGQEDLPPVEARKLLGPNVIIGFSTHTIEQAAEATRAPIDYIAFGPIFQTTTKSDHENIVGLELLQEVRQQTGDLPLVAIGGIDLSNLADVFAAGADSAAMISALVADPPNIAENTRKALSIVQSASLR
ncbi:MAG: thiamine phosphate synthase [Pyrinomonadaceae bacterium]